jgi:transposase-like protein
MPFNPDLIRAISNKNPIQINNHSDYKRIEPYCIGVDNTGSERIVCFVRDGKKNHTISLYTKLLKSFDVLDKEHFYDLQPGRENLYKELFVIYNKVSA